MVAKFSVVKPQPFAPQAVRDYINAKAKELGEFIKQDFDNVTLGWEGERPIWTIKYIVNQSVIMIKIVAEDTESLGAQKFMWLDNGTAPHSIVPRTEGGVLVFQPGYNAGSAPGVLRTFRKSRFGDTVYTTKVEHPGFEARNWTKLLVENWKQPYYEWMRAVISEAIRRTGYAK